MKLQFQILFILVVSPLIRANLIFEHGPTKLDYYNAVNYCKGRYMDLVKIEDSVKNKLVFSYAVENKLGRYWINGNDINQESIWVDTDGNELEFRNWRSDEPNGGRSENCIEGNRHKEGLWNDIECSDKNTVICETTKRVTVVDYDTQFISAPEKLKYAEALDFCKANKKDLLKITDAAINLAAHRYAIAKKIDEYWVNGNDEVEESKWLDTNEKTLKFRDWYHTQPNGGREENCIAAGIHDSEAWDDVSCLEKYWVIC